MRRGAMQGYSGGAPAQVLAPSIHDPPSTANADNWEFVSASGIGRANGGSAVGPATQWKALREDTMALITPVVGLDPYTACSTANDARWEVGYRPSCLSWQALNANVGGVTTNQWFYVPLTTPLTTSGSTKWGVSCSLRMVFAHYNIPNAASDGLCIFALAPDNGSGKPDLSQNWAGIRLDAGIAGSGNWKLRLQQKAAGTVTDVMPSRQMSSGNLALAHMDRFGIIYAGSAAGAGYLGGYYGTDSTLQWLSNNAGSLTQFFGGAAKTFAYVCFQAKCDVGGSQPQSIWHLDYLRVDDGRLP